MDAVIKSLVKKIINEALNGRFSTQTLLEDDHERKCIAVTFKETLERDISLDALGLAPLPLGLLPSLSKEDCINKLEKLGFGKDFADSLTEMDTDKFVDIMKEIATIVKEVASETRGEEIKIYDEMSNQRVDAALDNEEYLECSLEAILNRVGHKKFSVQTKNKILTEVKEADKTVYEVEVTAFIIPQDTEMTPQDTMNYFKSTANSLKISVDQYFCSLNELFH